MKKPSELIVVKGVTTILRPAEELYPFWKDMENLPTIIAHLDSVRIIDERHSHWVFRGPAGRKIEWTARITEDAPGKVLSWRSIEGSDSVRAASVQFKRAYGDRGTIVEVTVYYDPPGGNVGATLLKLFGDDPEKEIQQGLRRFKQLMETGEILTTEGQPSGRERTQETEKAA
jgi:uncharacterized membrane protein